MKKNIYLYENCNQPRQQSRHVVFLEVERASKRRVRLFSLVGLPQSCQKVVVLPEALMTPWAVDPVDVTPKEAVAAAGNVPSDNHKHYLDVENPKHWVPWVLLYSGVNFDHQGLGEVPQLDHYFPPFWSCKDQSGHQDLPW